MIEITIKLLTDLQHLLELLTSLIQKISSSPEGIELIDVIRGVGQTMHSWWSGLISLVGNLF